MILSVTTPLIAKHWVAAHFSGGPPCSIAHKRIDLAYSRQKLYHNLQFMKSS